MLIEIRGVAATILIIIVTLGLGLQASRAGPAALILDIEGPRQPNVQPFDELTTEMPLELGEASRIVFHHYATCDKVTVTGGELYFFEGRYLVRKGNTNRH